MGAKYRIRFYFKDAARLPRKKALCRDMRSSHGHYLTIAPAERRDTICIEVDHPSHLFLAGEAMIPTHNSDASGDYSAWITLGVDADWTLWVDADMSNVRPVEPLGSAPGQHSIVSDGFYLAQEFKPVAILVEVNGFQEWVARALERFAAEHGNLMLPIFTVNHSITKGQRIRAGLSPYLAQKRLRIKNTPGGRLLLQQIREYSSTPGLGAQYDDGPDALSSAEQMANYIITGQSAETGGIEVLRG